MMKLFGIFFFAVTIAVTYGDVINATTLVDSSNLFAFKFLDTIFQKTDSTGESFIFSPYSIRAAAALLYGGADGLTSTQMMNGFKFAPNKTSVGNFYKNSIEHLQSKNSLFTVANKIYITKDKTIAPSFLELATNNFHSEVENIEFSNSEAAAQNINEWVKEKTHGKISEVVQPESLTEDTQLLAVNAIYFKGQWKRKFETYHTQMEDFYTKPGETVKVEMMHVKAPAKYIELHEYAVKMAEYPFRGGSTSMFFLAPMEPERDLLQVQHILHYLVYEKDIFSKLKDVDAMFSLPKFKIDFDINCLESFTQMGMDKVSGADGDFNNILSPPQNLPLTKLTHKATIEINEEAAEASGATSGMIESRIIPIYIDVKFNQSFLYFIRGKNGQIYFMGKYTGK